jgi:hypothetical protein
MGGVTEWKEVLKIGTLFAILSTVVDAYVPRLFRAASRLPRSWTFPLRAGYLLQQAFLGVWLGMAMTFGRRAFQGLLAAVFAAASVGLLVATGLFARAVQRQSSQR